MVQFGTTQSSDDTSQIVAPLTSMYVAALVSLRSHRQASIGFVRIHSQSIIQTFNRQVLIQLSELPKDNIIIAEVLSVTGLVVWRRPSFKA